MVKAQNDIEALSFGIMKLQIQIDELKAQVSTLQHDHEKLIAKYHSASLALSVLRDSINNKCDRLGIK